MYSDVEDEYEEAISDSDYIRRMTMTLQDKIKTTAASEIACSALAQTIFTIVLLRYLTSTDEQVDQIVTNLLGGTVSREIILYGSIILFTAGMVHLAISIILYYAAAKKNLTLLKIWFLCAQFIVSILVINMIWILATGSTESSVATLIALCVVVTLRVVCILNVGKFMSELKMEQVQNVKGQPPIPEPGFFQRQFSKCQLKFQNSSPSLKWQIIFGVIITALSMWLAS